MESSAVRRSARSRSIRRARRRRRVSGLRAGVLVSDRKGRRIAGPARGGDPHREGCVPRTARGRISEKVGCGRELLQAVLRGCWRRMRASPARCCTSRPTTSRWQIGWPRISRRTTGAVVRLRVCDALRHTAGAAGAACGEWQAGSRVLISYGEYWFPWYMRRLAERPANIWFVVRTMFG